jgi:CRP-like cAMP-binding protein
MEAIASAGSAALGAGWFGAGLSPHAVEWLDANVVIRDYDVDETIMSEGEEGPPFGIVSAGRVALRLLVGERGPVTVMTVEPGDIVGWSALVPPYRATSTVVATVPSRLLTIDAASLRRALRADSALAATVYPRVLEAMARRLGATRHQLLDLYARETERRP